MKPKYLITAALALSCGLVAATAGARGLTQSKEKVSASVATADVADNGGMTLCLKLDMQDDWHVNANPASLDFLIPTRITATAAGQTLAIDADWPQGHSSGITLAGQTVMVYSDNTTIPVRIDAAGVERIRQTGEVDLAIEVQACGANGMCLMPSTIRVATRPTQTSTHC